MASCVCSPGTVIAESVDKGFYVMLRWEAWQCDYGQTHRVCSSKSALTWYGDVCWSQCPHWLNQTSHPTARSEGQRSHGKYVGLSNFQLTFCKSKSTLKSQVQYLLFFFASINCEIKKIQWLPKHPPTHTTKEQCGSLGERPWVRPATLPPIGL